MAMLCEAIAVYPNELNVYVQVLFNCRRDIRHEIFVCIICKIVYQ